MVKREACCLLGNTLKGRFLQCGLGGGGGVVAWLGSYACAGRRRSVVSVIRVGGGMGRKNE